MKDIPGLFGSMVFNDSVMRDRLPKDTYKAVKESVETSVPLSLETANVVANAMKDWAVEKGATHFTHWFQPMTGITAEKHDAFISPCGKDKVVMEFSGKALIQGEPDASSFPSGGLRATFEARGYTAWDPTSYAYIKEGVLCIPTAFCSYSGEALDKKTPLMRSMEALDKQAMRILRLFGDDKSRRVITTVGAEQEYFLIDKSAYDKRIDLINCGRTLLGSRPAKGQELEDHYFGAIKTRVSDYMSRLDEELWKLGIYAKTRHNEVAPAQHELAPVFTTTNIAVDHNQLVMEMMKKVAQQNGLVCLLHEKPFEGINGSGKHNNWAISTDRGKNLLEPGETPFENAQFLLFLTAVLKAVDEHQDLLRLSAASAGNDHRLGASEAPPAIVSVFLGDELTEVLDAVMDKKPYNGKLKKGLEIGVSVLPRFPKDSTDRNRTSPFAFTGNKFEFRMVGSAFSLSGPNIILNTIVAEALNEFADILEQKTDFKAALNELITATLIAHKRIVFNGNNYADEWVKESKKRGLPNLRSTPEALPCFVSPQNIALFEKHKVFSAAEIHARYEILSENYCKTLHIEALTMVDMVQKEVLPAVMAYQLEISGLLKNKLRIGGDLDCSLETETLRLISTLSAEAAAKLATLETAAEAAHTARGVKEQAFYYLEHVAAAMKDLRKTVDLLETKTARKYWPYPSYTNILFSVR
ncbi:MAG: glutamine synthetase III [Clostridiales bacterium]|jgi:glutamine synthetase|nr:glutamine synthetase III [Clostridiales bacterium]